MRYVKIRPNNVAASTANVYAADFETLTFTDYEVHGKTRVYVWSLRSLENDVEYMGCTIEEFFECVRTLKCKRVWFHNLKFDGSFIEWYALHQGEYSAKKPKDRHSLTSQCLVTDMGQWMHIKIRWRETVCEFCDSAKKFPGFSLSDIVNIYQIKNKTEDDFEKYRGWDYVPDEIDLLRVSNDTRILAIAMRDLYRQGFTALTMASDAKNFFMALKGTDNKAMNFFNRMFPPIKPEINQIFTNAYRGGWVYVNPEYKEQDLQDVDVIDVNSMFPAQMYYRKLPCGMPYYTMKEPKSDLFIVRFKASFKLKENGLPFIQRRNSLKSTHPEFVEESDGLEELVLTSVDFKLFQDMYEILYDQDYEYWVFNAAPADLFRPYIDHWMREKIEGKKSGDKARVATAKRFLNSLYGKFGEKIERTQKIPHLVDDVVRFTETSSDNGGWYLPMAEFITAYARDRIIRSSQLLKDNFVYSDTDSIHFIHCKLPKEIEIDKTKLGAWDLEEEHIANARYLRAKTYIHADKDGNTSIKDIKCCGLPDKCKDQVTWDNFVLGAYYDNKLLPRQVPGGCILKPSRMFIRYTKGIITPERYQKQVEDWLNFKYKYSDEDMNALLEDTQYKESDPYWKRHKGRAYRKKMLEDEIYWQ